MTKLLLSLHVLAAIVAIGPVTVAASMFPAALRRATPGGTGPTLLHRICRVYAGLGLLVPVFGLATASSLGVLTDAWLIASMLLTAVAGVLLAFVILPAQAAALGGPGKRAAVRLGMVTGVFNLLWATVVVLMVIRPGSTTGV
ncbi:hypothetical protein COUCH_06940 [Couchioplanes caeruleus]|uniref:hypothetical protein n=1 Tax=Couchioplanes caeruleus TaxID=56438 RepID=UPI0020BDED3D|nr:hypothetical protein [Couchioplanes caeruleus]UQU66029.1 hypothetical protein COUCH_06940 [Couchioplanes caeruleus]